MKRAKLLFFVSISLLLTAVLFQQCRQDDLNWDNEGTPYVYATHLYGTVVDEQQNPISGATVTCLDFTTSTDENGFFQFEKAYVVKGRTQIQVSYNGFFDSFKTINTKKAHTNTKVMMSVKQTKNIFITENPTVGGNFEQMTINLPTGGYVYDDGTPYANAFLQASYKHFNPEDDFFSLQMPGGDFMGVNEEGEEQLLVSFGALSLELTDMDGNQVQLGEGQTATIRMKVPTPLLAEAPASIPLWHFDEEKGQWVEEGEAKLEGLEYVGEVSHFSSWNFDHPTDPRAFINGYVVDCRDNPMPNVEIQVGPRLIQADEKGYYEATVAVNDKFQVYVPAQYNLDMGSQSITVLPLQLNERKAMDKLIMPCPTLIEGVIHNCRGELIPGTVQLNWSSGQNLVYSEDGNFSIMVNGQTSEEIEINVITVDFLRGQALVNMPINGETLKMEEAVLACDELEANCPSLVCLINNVPFTFFGYSSRYGKVETVKGPYFEELAKQGYNHKVISIFKGNTEAFHIFVPEIAVGTYKISPLYDDKSAFIGLVKDNAKSADFLKLNGELIIQEVGPEHIIGYFSGRRINVFGEHIIDNGSFCIPYQ